METIEAIRKRYSCRNYSDNPVSKEVVVQLLELANLAPSAANNQNRQFVVITDSEDRQYLADMNHQPHIGVAPVVILFSSKLNRENARQYLEYLKKWDMTVNTVQPDKVEVTGQFENDLREMYSKWEISDVAAAVENFMLVAVDKGLSTCWIGIMDFPGVKKRFGLPEEYTPICLVTLGYEKEEPTWKAPRKNISELIHWEKW
jgi:nitroreductase